MASSRIRVGIVGASTKGFAPMSHIPALRALPDDFEIVAVSTSSQKSAEAAAKHHGIPLAFANAEALAEHPEVDLVTVCVKAPDHHRPVMAAIAAGKHVYCEWPLAQNTAAAVEMRDAAVARGIQHAVGLQGQVDPTINYVRDLIAEGFIGRPLAAALIANAPNWGSTLSGVYQADAANGANLLTVTGGHNADLLCHMLGEFRELAGYVVSQRDTIPEHGTDRHIPKTSPDQLAISGLIGEGIAVSLQIRGGVTRGTPLLLEIHGAAGDLVITATEWQSTQRQDLLLKGAQGEKGPLIDLPIPDSYRWVPANTPRGTPYNIAQLYLRLATAIRGGTAVYPDFNAAVTRHRMLDAMVRASVTGQKQVVSGG
jgi:predicted dehydrogenase